MIQDSKEKTISVLHNLLRACTTVQYLFKTAANEVDNKELKEVFTSFANQKQEYVEKLKKEIFRISGDEAISDGPDPDITFSSRNNTRDIIKKVEENIEKNYTSAMQEELLWEVIPVVARQLDGIKESRKVINKFYGNA